MVVHWQLRKQKMHFGAYLIPLWPWPLTFWSQNVTRSYLSQSPLLVKVWSNSVNKYPRHLAKNVCLGPTHTHMHAQTLWKHNVSSQSPLHWRRHKKLHWYSSEWKYHVLRQLTIMLAIQVQFLKVISTINLWIVTAITWQLGKADMNIKKAISQFKFQ